MFEWHDNECQDSFCHMILIANIRFYVILTIHGEIVVWDDLTYDDIIKQLYYTSVI